MTSRKVLPSTGGRKSWRDVLKVHPAAAAYPRLSDDELAELGADIKARGLQVDIVLFLKDTKTFLLDGVSRLDAIEANGFNLFDKDGKLDRSLGLGGGPRMRVVCGVDPVAMVDSLNLHRRHLTQEQKRKHIEALLKAAPEKSNRAIAKVAKVDDKTVAAVRADKEATAEIPQLEKHTGADGKTRKQPTRTAEAPRALIQVPLQLPPPAASKPPRHRGQPTPAQKAAEIAVWQRTDVGLGSSAELERKLARLAELEDTTRRLEIKNLALENELKDLVEASRKPASLIDALTAALAAIETGGKASEMAIAAIAAIRRLLLELQSPAPVQKKKKTAAPEKLAAPANDPSDDFYIPPGLDRVTKH